MATGLRPISGETSCQTPSLASIGRARQKGKRKEKKIRENMGGKHSKAEDRTKGVGRQEDEMSGRAEKRGGQQKKELG